MAQADHKAFILRVTDYGETDKIVTLFSGDKGRISTIAKGARRSKKRFVNKLEPFTLLAPDILQQRLTTLGMLKDAELVCGFHPLRTNYHRYLAASLVIEAMLSWTREHDPDPHLFELLSWCLFELCDAGEVATPLLLFFVRMAALQGFRPHMHSCRICGADTSGNVPLSFSFSAGGVVCGRCERPATPPILPGTAKLLEKAITMPIAALSRLKITRQSAIPALEVIIDYHRYLLQRDFRSWPLVKKNICNSAAA